MKTKEGNKYSLSPFLEYKFRAKFVVEDMKGEQITNTDVYTTNESKEDVERILRGSVFKNYDENDIYSAKIVGWSSQEQDKLSEEFLKTFLP